MANETELPAREMLADMLLDLQRPQEALTEYEISLRTDPNRFNGLYGAAQAAAQAVAFVDRAPLAAAAENGTLELVLPGWQWRRRSWPAHRACSCGGARSAGP